MKLIQNILLLLLLARKFLVCEATCEMYIHSKVYPKLFWYATNDSRVVLSESSRTLWRVYVPKLGIWTGSLSIQVLNGTSDHLKGLYMDIDKSASIVLRKVIDGEITPLWTLRNYDGLLIRPIKTGLFADILYIQEPLIWFNNQYVDINLTDDVTQKGVKWIGDIEKDCARIFGKKELQSVDSKIIHKSKNHVKVTTHITRHKTINITRKVTHINVVETAPNATKTIVGNSTFEDFHSKKEYYEEKRTICIDEHLRVINVKVNLSSCLSASTDAEIKSLFDKAYVKVAHDNTTSQVMKFLEKVDVIALNIAKNLPPGKEKNIKSKEFELSVKHQQFPFLFPSAKSAEKIVVNIDDGLNNSYTMVGILYKSIHKNMKDEVSLENDRERYHISSKLISASIVEDVLVRKVVIELPLEKQEEGNEKTLCAFWNTTGGNGGIWSTKGCKKIFSQVNNTKITCECDHLTNFALLTATVIYKIPDLHRKILDKLSLVCCCVSLVFLFIGINILLLLTCRAKKHTRYTIHLNLMITLFISQLLFVTGIDVTANKVACQTVAYLLHYFLLVSFMWMLLEGLYLYFLMVKVFTDRKTNFNMYMLFAWGLPAILVAITGASSHRSYGTAGYCWLSNKDSAIWAFLGPVLLIIVVNMIILFMIIHQIIILSKRDSVAHDVKMGLRSSLILLPILGVGWVTGMLSVNLETIVFQYIFAITNGLQGFMITVFHCILNEEVRKGMRRLFEVWIHSSYFGRHFQRGSATNSRVNREEASWSLTRTAEDALNRNTTKSSSSKFIESSWDDKTNDFRVETVEKDD